MFLPYSSAQVAILLYTKYVKCLECIVKLPILRWGGHLSWFIYPREVECFTPLFKRTQRKGLDRGEVIVIMQSEMK